MNKAFSLVELSIVLVILGLLVGGVLTGQSLIRAAELRSVSTQFQQFQTAIQTFRDRFFALPGDMRNAEDFWGSATCPAGTGTGAQTCNGNGDGRISRAGASASQSTEEFSVWQHMANAGLIEGSFTGIAGGTSNIHQLPGENVPMARINNAIWYIGSNMYSGNGRYTDGVFDNFISMGEAGTANITNGSVIAPEEAWNIDTKIDDGLPQQGRVWAIGWNSCTDAADSADTNGEYALTTTSVECGLLFVDPF